MENNHSLARRLIIAAVILVLAAAYLALFFRSNRDRHLSENPSEANRILGDAVASKLLSRCGELRGVVVAGTDYEAVCRGNIGYTLALETLDASYCDALGALGPADDCRSKVARAEVSQSRNLASCDAAVGERAKADCVVVYWSLAASERRDRTLCGNISDKDARAACESGLGYQEFLSDPERVSCSNIPVALAGECALMKRAIQSGRASDCYAISDPVMARKCSELVKQ